MQVLTDDGTSLDVRTDGLRTADPVVLVHGFPFAHALWQQQIASLANANYTIAPDLRGMGASSVAPGPYLMEVLAADVAAILDALSIDRAAIVGHSLGGYVALAFARMFAERVTRLALVCSRLAADTPERAQARERLASELERTQSIESLTGDYLLQLLAPQTPRERPEILDFARNLVRGTTPDGAAAMLRGMAVRTASDDIAVDLDIPILVVAGAHDATIPIEESREIAATFPTADIVICDRSGHLPMLENPAPLTSTLANFLS